ncbi:hypothetical protein [Marinimicrobium sp. ABcell2]|uniref:hypothetical protein n=1 Tax=Marinimicrobium sp. ABcell2 TaxID=3069751 RepID=UPI0027AE684E|nr:hypothetical protein [Marinimicrobium sp. ABcell2]MDQ2077534.1 hypothetical protein [Marinimicrobium sp. ABcell2]
MRNPFSSRTKVIATRVDGTSFWVSIDDDPALTFVINDPATMADNATFAALGPKVQREVVKAIHRTGGDNRRPGGNNYALIAAIGLLGLVGLASVGQLSGNQPGAAQQCGFGATAFEGAFTPNQEGLSAAAIAPESRGMEDLKALNQQLQAMRGPQSQEATEPTERTEYEFAW